MILIAGGSQDPNINAVHAVLESSGDDFIRLNTDTLAIHFDVNDCEVYAGPHKLEFDAMYARPNVFMPNTATNAERLAQSVWYDTLIAYCIASGKRIVNSRHTFERTAKVRNLLWAKECGFTLPRTYVTEQPTKASDGFSYIQKPVLGGSHTLAVESITEALSNGPVFLQERLLDYDMRIYAIGDTVVAFYMQSPSVDYRELQDAVVVHIEDISVYEPYIEPLRQLAGRLKLDYCCVDLKKNKEDETYSFLEINTLPMHAAFDAKCGMALSQAIRDLLYADN